MKKSARGRREVEEGRDERVCPRGSSRAAIVVSSTWPLRIRAVPRKPSAYSTRNAIGIVRNDGRLGGGTKSRVFWRTSPGLQGMAPRRARAGAALRPEPLVASLPDGLAFQAGHRRQRPAVAASRSRRSTMHWSDSRAWKPKISISPREATTASFQFNAEGDLQLGEPPGDGQARAGHQRDLGRLRAASNISRGLGSVVREVLVDEDRDARARTS